MSFYPEKISARFYEAKNAGEPAQINAAGTGASFVCGAFVRFYLEIDAPTKEIKGAKFKTSGCGFAIAAADVLAEKISGKRLPELHGADDSFLKREIEAELGEFENARRHCLNLCLDALHQALADFRALQIEEFQGEKALICTCFGVSEETIERVIDEGEAATVEEVGDACNAGTGCGSCQFLIAEMLDAHSREGLWIE